ncbi:MAG: YciI family protein, partial [Devosia sp.]
MTRFLVVIHLQDGHEPSAEDVEMHRDIDMLNDEMRKAGVIAFVGGLAPAIRARSVRARPGGELLVTDGPYLETKEHIGGFWVLEVASMDEAVAWGRKAAVACRA